jgi:hypothetical protein
MTCEENVSVTSPPGWREGRRKDERKKRLLRKKKVVTPYIQIN